MATNNAVNNILYGTTTNNNAAAGQVGEYISSSVLFGSAVSLPNATAINVTSISLTAGDWDVSGMVVFRAIPVGSTFGNITSALNTTSATLPTSAAENNASFLVATFALDNSQCLNVGPMRLSLAATTTVYLIAFASVSGTASAYGFIGARRVR